MTFLKTVAAAFSMFSAVPMPQFPWKRDNMRYVLCAFPLVGALIGLICWLWIRLCTLFELPAVVQGAVLCLIPVLLTGGIHLDGYADVCDALASHGSREKKLEILKDPHTGAFAMIRLCALFVLVFALWSALPEYRPVAVLLGFCLSRVLSGLAVASFPLAKDTGLVHTFSEAADRRRVRGILIALDLVLSIGLCLCGIHGAAMMLAAQAVWGVYYCKSRRQFGGITGDLAGWFLVQAEKWMLIALFATEILEKKL